MRNIRFVVSYDGTDYEGFQTQPSGKAVQDKLEHAIALLTGERVKMISSGRTDAGVHARRQVVNFHTLSRIPIERWSVAMNSRLPQDIAVVEAQEAAPDFHARHSAKRKTYCYRIWNSTRLDVFKRHTHYHHYSPLDTGLMREACQWLKGTHDFTSFSTVRSAKRNRIRTLYEAEIVEIAADRSISWEAKNDREIWIVLTGSGFLYNMVRIIAGTLLEIGMRRREPAEMTSILVARDRAKAGPTAVPHGLILWDVLYDEP